KFKARIVVGLLVFLALGIAYVVLAPVNPSGSGKLQLPVGSKVPAIALGQRHGLILASDGSLWSWGSDFLGWPVLGLGTINKSTKLRRIGTETNWASISANHVHNLAIKMDGTLWTWGQSVEPQLVGMKMISSPVPAAP